MNQSNHINQSEKEKHHLGLKVKTSKLSEASGEPGKGE